MNAGRMILIFYCVGDLSRLLGDQQVAELAPVAHAENQLVERHTVVDVVLGLHHGSRLMNYAPPLVQTQMDTLCRRQSNHQLHSDAH